MKRDEALDDAFVSAVDAGKAVGEMRETSGQRATAEAAALDAEPAISK